MKLSIESEKVLKAAKKCSTAKEILETLFPEVFNKPEPQLCRGDIFVIEDQTVMLSQVTGSQMTLICIGKPDPGNRWDDPVYVKDPIKVTIEEFKSLLGGMRNAVEEIIKTGRKQL